MFQCCFLIFPFEFGWFSSPAERNFSSRTAFFVQDEDYQSGEDVDGDIDIEDDAEMDGFIAKSDDEDMNDSVCLLFP